MKHSKPPPRRPGISDASVLKAPRRLLAGCAAALVLTSCAGDQDVDATSLTIVTTEASLDHAMALAVADYVTEQSIDVEVEQHHEPDDVFAALETDTESPADHARIGIVTAHQDPTLEENPLRVPQSLDIITQAPAELGLVPATSTVTAARFELHQDDDEADQPLAQACEQQTWLHVHTPDHEVGATATALADLGCQPEFAAASTEDAESYVALAETLIVEDDTVALLYSIDPMIPDQGLAALDVVTDRWPHSNVIAVADPEVEDPLTDYIATVLQVLDSDAATDLLRGYYDAHTSSSDLVYDVEHAIRYWLAARGLAEQDTVSDISTGND